MFNRKTNIVNVSNSGSAIPSRNTAVFSGIAGAVVVTVHHRITMLLGLIVLLLVLVG